MARIEWAHLCELAFMDSYERLCMIGIAARFSVPTLPIALRQLMIAARVVDVQAGDTLNFGVSMTMPNAASVAPSQSEGFEITLAGQYVLITLWSIPFREPGPYRFSVLLDEGEPVFLDVQVELAVAAENSKFAVETPPRNPRGHLN